MKKIVRITTVPLSLEKLLEKQLRFMSAHYEVIAVSSEGERLQKFGESESVRTFEVQLTRKITPWQDLKAVWQLYRFLKREKPFIVHSHTPKAGIVGMLASRLAGVPNRLHTVAGLPLLEAKGLKRMVLNAVERLTYAFATHVYPNSKGLQQIILKENFCSSSKLKVIGEGSSNGIDTHYFSKNNIKESDALQLKTQLNIGPEDFVFVFVGRIVGDKGINELMAAFERLSNEHDKVKLLLVGPYEEDLDPLSETTKKRIEANENCISVGYQQEVRMFFSISNCLVFPSYREGFPNVVLQAGAMGLPGIVTNINGCNEIITHERNGLIVSVKSSEELYLAMHRILTEKELYFRLQQHARKAITSRFEQQVIWKALLAEYQKLEHVS